MSFGVMLLDAIEWITIVPSLSLSRGCANETMQRMYNDLATMSKQRLYANQFGLPQK